MNSIKKIEQGDNCPVSLDQVNQYVVKIYSSIVLFTLIYTMFSGSYYGVYLLTLDFMIRVFLSIKYSPLCILITYSLKITQVPPKMIDSQRKKIAAYFGLFFSVLISLFSLVHLFVPAVIVAVMFSLAIAIDLIFDYCLACKISSWFGTNI
jgi:hypothetical protein